MNSLALKKIEKEPVPIGLVEERKGAVKPDYTADVEITTSDGKKIRVFRHIDKL